MFKLLRLRSIDSKEITSLTIVSDLVHCERQPLALLSATILSFSLLTGCQQPIENSTTVETEEPVVVDDSQKVSQSDSATAYIEQLKPLYVEQALKLQQRLRAEYEALQVADMPKDGESLLTTTGPNVASDTADTSSATPKDSSIVSTTNNPATVNTNAPPETNSELGNSPDIDLDVTTATSLEAMERDLSVLRSISFEPQNPIMLTQSQIEKRYEQAIDALYQPLDTPLSSEESNTLINIATLVPQLFEHTELANRMSIKSPALARLIVQQQVWEQIQARQTEYMDQMKLTQQQEFEGLMAKFDETIKGYDEQIAKYEQTLKEFQ